jgi:hypothetical protein
MDKNLVIRTISRATLWAAAFAVVISPAAVPQLSAQSQDNQRVSPSQAEPAQPPAMQRPDTAPAQPNAEPDMNSQNPQHDMDQRKDEDQDRSRVSQGDTDRDRDRDIDQADVKAFDQFLDSHPEVAKDLQRDPSLVDDHQFVSSHPGLQEFLENHPNIRREIKAHPEAFMKKEQKYENHEQH